MNVKSNKTLAICIVISLCLCEYAVCYRSEIAITPAPPEEATTKAGFFGGIKNFFRGSPTTTTTTPPSVLQVITPSTNAFGLQSPQSTVAGGAQRPPPLSISHAPLMPLQPRPDTPPSSPLAGNQVQPPQWPQTNVPTIRPPQPPSQYVPNMPTPTQYSPQQPQSSHSLPQNTQNNGIRAGQQQQNTGQSNLPPGFAPFHPPKPLPSGIDLSYGAGDRLNGGSGRPNIALAPIATSTTSTSTTTTPKSVQPQQPMNFDLRGGAGGSVGGGGGGIATTSTRRPSSPKEEFPPLPQPRRPSAGTLPLTPSSPSGSPSPGPPSPWGSPNSPIPHSPLSPSAPSPSRPTVMTPTPSSPGTAPPRPGTPPFGSPTPPHNGVSFIPRAPGSAATTTVRPGFENTGNSLATDDEIYTLTETLYNKETNSQLNLLRVNPQGKTRSIDSGDEAPQPLLEVDPRALQTPTIAKMHDLFNNYEIDTMVNEHVTPNERKEENDFVDAVMSTNVMRQAMLFLQNKGIVTPDPKTHRDLVKELWFTQYSRGSGKIGSSGFEHVFVNEVKNGTIIGLHNWVYFYEEEKAGHLDYKGYLNQLDIGTKGKILKVRFTHNGLNKPVNTLFVGTSPELELALYTVCFKLRPDRTCPVSLGNSRFGIVTYSWRYRGKSLIGSAYPEI